MTNTNPYFDYFTHGSEFDTGHLPSAQATKEFNDGMKNIEEMFTSTVLGDTTRWPSFEDERAAQRRAAKESKDKSTRIKRCADCREMRTARHFSTNQWTKPSPRCSACCKK